MSTDPVPAEPVRDVTTRPGYADMAALARLLDSRFRIPGTQRTFGVDALLNLVPGVGGAAGLALSAVVIAQAIGLGARGATVGRMVLHATVDAALNAVPVLGWVADVVYKANQRNVRLLEAHQQDPERTRGESRRVLGWAVVVVVAVGLLVTAAAVALVVVLVRVLAG